jgi:hypothetical protein
VNVIENEKCSFGMKTTPWDVRDITRWDVWTMCVNPSAPMITAVINASATKPVLDF